MRGYYLRFLALILFLGSVTTVAETGRNCPSAFERLTGIIESNFFQTRREFSHYVSTFPQSFSERLARLGPQDHWIDAGSGEAFALEDFFKQQVVDAANLKRGTRPGFFRQTREQVSAEQAEFIARAFNLKDGSQKPRVTGISFVMEREPPKHEKLQIKTDRFFEDIPLEELGSAELISDLYGVMSYSPRLDEVLRRYHQILKPGGLAYVHIGDYIERPLVPSVIRSMAFENPGWDAPFANSQVRKANGQTVSLLEWVQNLPGFKVSLEYRDLVEKSFRGEISGVIKRYTLVLEKTQESAQIPSLRLTESDSGKPPTRTFLELSP